METLSDSTTDEVLSPAELEKIFQLHLKIPTTKQLYKAVDMYLMTCVCSLSPQSTAITAVISTLREREWRERGERREGGGLGVLSELLSGGSLWKNF